MKAPQILMSDNYDQFVCVNGNRPVNERKVRGIIEEIDKGLNLLMYFPILVYKDGNQLWILDGQHRYEVSVRIGSYVFYVVADKLTLRQIAALNSKSSGWSIRDFLKCYVKVGLEDYITLQNVVSEYQVNISVAATLLSEGMLKHQTTVMEKF